MVVGDVETERYAARYRHLGFEDVDGTGCRYAIQRPDGTIDLSWQASRPSRSFTLVEAWKRLCHDVMQVAVDDLITPPDQTWVSITKKQQWSEKRRSAARWLAHMDDGALSLSEVADALDRDPEWMRDRILDYARRKVGLWA